MTKEMFLAINAAIFFGDNERPSFIEAGDWLIFTGAISDDHFKLLQQAGIEGANTTTVALPGCKEYVLACAEHPQNLERFSTVLLKPVDSMENFNNQFPELVKTRMTVDKTLSVNDSCALQA